MEHAKFDTLDIFLQSAGVERRVRHLVSMYGAPLTQVKEPEGYTDKKQKKRQADGGEGEVPLKRPRNHADKTRSITEFFKGPGRVALEGETAGGPAPSSAGGAPTVQPSQTFAVKQGWWLEKASERDECTKHVCMKLAMVADSGGQGRDELRRRMADAASKRAQQSEPSRPEADPVQQGARSSGGKKPSSKQQADLHSFLKAPTTAQGSSGERPRGKGGGGSTEPSCSTVIQVEKADHAGKLKDPWDPTEGEGGSSRQSGGEGGSSSRVLSLLAGQSFVDEIKCPVCGEILFAVSNSDLNAHVDRCLAHQGSPGTVLVLE